MSEIVATTSPSRESRIDRPFRVFPQAVFGSPTNGGRTDRSRWSNGIRATLRGLLIVSLILPGLGLLLVGLVPALFAAFVLLLVGLTPLLLVGFGIWLTEGVGLPDEMKGQGGQFQI